MPLPDRAVPVNGGGEAVWAEARRLYEQTDTPAAEIATLVGAGTTKALCRKASRRGWKRHGWPHAGARIAAEGKAAALALPRPADTRRALVARLERTVAREIAAIDARLRRYAGDEAAGRAAKGGVDVDHERNAKALATLARTLRELAAIDRDRAGTTGRAAQAAERENAEDDDDEFPRDADALRETLARRLEQLSRQRPDGRLPRRV